MLDRHTVATAVGTALRRSPVAALLGPRQCGKTTLARAIAAARTSTWFDLESSVDRARLQNPELVLGQLRGLVVLDEIQMMPELFAVLRVLADRAGTPARFLILGSASPSLVRGASESLAGRVEFVELGGFTLGIFPPIGSIGYGRAADFPDRFSAGAIATVPLGGRGSCRRFWREISRNSDCRSRRRPCGDSGRWWRITTGRRETARRWPDPWASPTRPFGPGSMC